MAVCMSGREIMTTNTTPHNAYRKVVLNALPSQHRGDSALSLAVISEKTSKKIGFSKELLITTNATLHIAYGNVISIVMPSQHRSVSDLSLAVISGKTSEKNRIFKRITHYDKCNAAHRMRGTSFRSWCLRSIVVYRMCRSQSFLVKRETQYRILKKKLIATNATLYNIEKNFVLVVLPSQHRADSDVSLFVISGKTWKTIFWNILDFEE